MKIVGLIAEYNPFHNGHTYHLAESLRASGADYAVAVMSGNYVQRGLPAIVDKHTRARMALEAGVDAVFELPIVYSCASAEFFAYGAVGLLNQLGIDTISYGCECGPSESQKLRAIAELLIIEPEQFKATLSNLLRSGKSYPAASAAAIDAILPGCGALASEPNNILAIEYEKTILKQNLDINTVAIARSGAGHIETGTAIREALISGNSENVSALLPKSSAELLTYHIDEDAFSDMLAYKLLTENPENLTDYADVSPELAARIVRFTGKGLSFSQLADALTTKNYTKTRVQRVLIHILLGIRKETQAPTFARVLGLKKNSPVLHEIKERTQIPIVTKLADAPDESYQPDRIASDLYCCAAYPKGIKLPDEYHSQIVTI